MTTTAHPSRRPTSVVLALATAAAALAGCSNPLTRADVSVSSETTPAAPADPTTATTADPAAPTATAAPAPSAAPPAAATAAPATPDATPEATDAATPAAPTPEATDAATPAAPTEPLARVAGNAPFSEVRVTDLRRGDGLVTLEFELDTVPLGEDETASDYIIGDIFAAPTDQSGGEHNLEAEGGGDTRQSVSGTTLVDQVNQKRHLVVRDANNDCLCTNFPAVDVQPNATYRHSVQFAPPPDDVTSMSVQVLTFPVMDDVPLRAADQ